MAIPRTREQMIDAGIIAPGTYSLRCSCGVELAFAGIGFGSCVECGGDACEECAEMSDDERPTFRHHACRQTEV